MLSINLVPLAEVILKAAKLREDSWVSERKYYTLDKMGAAKEATVAVLGGENAEVAELVYLLITLAWNDSLDLAEAIKVNTAAGGQCDD